ncbi:hypothetical protein P168DRAFT_324350 [Aspergillus campestris IBT 28561]|uniref:GPI anchored protein n=1 Tax=Aspergillus campestris (strain IBT 28561) TaxID=1392248 RepID=A0A2I1DHN9_ASPC2|nr:uncharacterized protein P168DRAFT_324350 [Aspergillus campestris IBT 28561]PKY09380.1 hypothetical protein P168DRAFT_324350 [Aspergillus campestris IBT 28561]
MKLLTLAAAAALPTVSLAWEFTWHSADGESHTESGKGASECIKVNHAKGEVFRIDSKGEKFIDMRLYDTDDCEGDPSGQASKFFTKESSIAIKGFQVVQLNETGAPDDKEDEDDKDDEDDFTLPTVSSTPTPTATSTSADGGAKPTGASGSTTPSPTPSGSLAAPVVGGNMGHVAGAIGVACVVAGLFGY